MDGHVSGVDDRCAGCSQSLEPGRYLVVDLATRRSFHSVACLDLHRAAEAQHQLVGVLQARLTVSRDA